MGRLSVVGPLLRVVLNPVGTTIRGAFQSGQKCLNRAAHTNSVPAPWEQVSGFGFRAFMTVRQLQEQAAALFGLAEDAFDQGKTQLGEQLTALAPRYLDEGDALEKSPPQVLTKPQRPIVQQEQQVPPKDSDKE